MIFAKDYPRSKRIQLKVKFIHSKNDGKERSYCKAQKHGTMEAYHLFGFPGPRAYDMMSGFQLNSFKPGVPFMGHRQTE